MTRDVYTMTMFVTRLLLLLALLVTSTEQFIWSTAELGEITPKDPKACVGDSLVLTCNLTDTQRGNASDLVFELSRLFSVFNESLTNDTQAKQITFQNLTLEDHKGMVVCFVGSPVWENRVGQASIYVYERPRPVSSVHCVAYNWDSFLTCTFDIGVEWNLTTSKNFKFEWRLPRLAGDWKGCQSLTNVSATEVQCTWNQTNNFDMEPIELAVNISSPGCVDQVMQNFRFNVSDNVKPAPVSDLTVQVLNMSCCNVSWSHEKKYRAKKYQLSYHPMNGCGARKIENMRDSSLIICQLRPFTSYQFEVKVHPDQDSGYWSDTESREIQTKPDVPDGSPNVAVSSFRYNSLMCRPSEVIRRVYVYWKKLDDCKRNGPSPSLRVSSDPPILDESALSGRVLDDTGQVTWVLKCDQEYTVTLQYCDDKMCNPDNSTLRIPGVNTGAPVTKFRKLEMNTTADNRTVNIEWLPYKSQQADTFKYRLFWCNMYAGNCEGEMSWLELPGNITHTALRLDDPETYLYGIAVEIATGDGEMWRSNGFHAETCVHTWGTDPGAVTDVTVTTEAERNTLKVDWQEIPCQSGSPFITNYTIYYCVDCADITKQSVTVPYTTSSYILRNLVEGATYRFQLQAVTENKGGPLSEPMYGVPVDNSLKAGEVVGIVIGSCFGLIMVIVFICSCMSCCRKCHKKCNGRLEIEEPHIIRNDAGKDNPVFVTFASKDGDLSRRSSISMLGDLPGSPKTKSPRRQESVDSGIPDDPLTPPTKDEKQKLLKDGTDGILNLPDGYVRAGHLYQIEQDFLRKDEVTIGLVLQQPTVKLTKHVQNGEISSYCKINELSPLGMLESKSDQFVKDLPDLKKEQVEVLGGSQSSGHDSRQEESSDASSRPSSDGYSSDIVEEALDLCRGNRTSKCKPVDKTNNLNCVSNSYEACRADNVHTPTMQQSSNGYTHVGPAKCSQSITETSQANAPVNLAQDSQPISETSQAKSSPSGYAPVSLAQDSQLISETSQAKSSPSGYAPVSLAQGSKPNTETSQAKSSPSGYAPVSLAQGSQPNTETSQAKSPPSGYAPVSLAQCSQPNTETSQAKSSPSGYAPVSLAQGSQPNTETSQAKSSPSGYAPVSLAQGSQPNTETSQAKSSPSGYAPVSLAQGSQPNTETSQAKSSPSGYAPVSLAQGSQPNTETSQAKSSPSGYAPVSLAQGSKPNTETSQSKSSPSGYAPVSLAQGSQPNTETSQSKSSPSGYAPVSLAQGSQPNTETSQAKSSPSGYAPVSLAQGSQPNTETSQSKSSPSVYAPVSLAQGSQPNTETSQSKSSPSGYAPVSLAQGSQPNTETSQAKSSHSCYVPVSLAQGSQPNTETSQAKSSHSCYVPVSLAQGSQPNTETSQAKSSHSCYVPVSLAQGSQPNTETSQAKSSSNGYVPFSLA